MIQVKVDLQPIRTLMAGYADQMPFAIAAALNRTAEEAYAELRQSLPRRFKFRDPKLLKVLAPTRVMGERRATKNRLRVILDTETRAAKLFRSYEQGETTTPRNGNNAVAVPTRQLRGPGGMKPIPRWMFPENAGFQQKLVANPKGGPNRLMYAKGKAFKLAQFHQMFEINSPEVPWSHRGIYRANGDRIVKLWHYNPSVRKPRKLRWYSTIGDVVQRRWEINMRGMAAYAIRTARKGGGQRMAESFIAAGRTGAGFFPDLIGTNK